MKVDTKTTSTANLEPEAGSRCKSPLLWMAFLLALVLSVLFWKSYLPNQVVFASDDPLGGMTAEQTRMPGTIKGAWSDLNWLGNETLSPSPDITTLLMWIA